MCFLFNFTVAFHCFTFSFNKCCNILIRLVPIKSEWFIFRTLLFIVFAAFVSIKISFNFGSTRLLNNLFLKLRCSFLQHFIFSPSVLTKSYDIDLPAFRRTLNNFLSQPCFALYYCSVLCIFIFCPDRLTRRTLNNILIPLLKNEWRSDSTRMRIGNIGFASRRNCPDDSRSRRTFNVRFN